MDIVRTLGVAIDPTAAKAGGTAVSQSFDSVGKKAVEMEKNVSGAGRTVEKTGSQMQSTARAGDMLRETLNRQNGVLSQLTSAITQLTAKIESQRVSMAGATAEHKRASQAMTETDSAARSMTNSVNAANVAFRTSQAGSRETVVGYSLVSRQAAETTAQIARMRMEMQLAKSASGMGGRLGGGGAGVAGSPSAIVPYQGAALAHYYQVYDAEMGAMGKAMKNVTPLSQTLDIRGAAFDMEKAAAASTKLRGGINSLWESVTSFKSILIASGLAIFLNDLVRTELQVQRTANALRYASAGPSDYDRNQQFVKNTADQLGLNELSSSREYAKFMAAGKGTQFTGDELRAVYLSVAKASAVLSLSSDETAGALNALQQMISKGNVQAEELRGQLGERLPGAFNMAARAMGVTTKELNKMLDTGQITAYQLLPALAKELEKSFGKDAPKAAESLNAQLNRLNNTILQAKTNLTSGAFADILAAGSKAGQWTIKLVADNDTIKLINGLNNARKSGALSELVGLGVSTPTKEFAQALSPNAAYDERTAYRKIQNEKKKSASDAAEALQKLVNDELTDFFSELDAKTALQHEIASKAPARARAEWRDKINMEGDALRQSMFPEAKYSNQVAKLNELYRSGAIDIATFTKAVSDANADLDKTQLTAVNAELDAFFAKMDKVSKFELQWASKGGLQSGIDSYVRQQNGTAGIREDGAAAGATDEQIAKTERLAAEMTRMRNIGTGAAQAIENGFSSFTDSMVNGTKSIGEAFRDMTAGILRDIASIVARQMIAAPIAGALSSFLGGVAGGIFSPGTAAASTGSSAGFSSSFGSAPTANIGIHHTGGIVGYTPSTSRQMPISLFHNAPRFHNGLRPDEFPAILQKGETVVPKGQSGDMTPITIPITVNVNSSDGGSSDHNRDFGAEVARQMEAMVDKRIERALRPNNLMRRSGR